MSDSHPHSPSSRPRPSSQTNPRSRSRSLTPRHENTPSPPRRSSRKSNSVLTPPSRKRYRSTSPRPSPPRKSFRPSPNRSRSPSRHPYQYRPPYQSRSPYRSHRSPPPHYRRSPDNRYTPPRYRSTRSISPPRYRSSPRKTPPSPPIRSSPNQHPSGRRRYYSPPPRPFPVRYGREYSPQPYRSRHPETRYPPSEPRRPTSRPSYPSRSRSPRRRRDRRRRDKRRRQREPLSPSSRIPDEQVHQLFLEALKLVLRYRRPPFNISVISDYMSSIDPKWSIRKTQYPTFSDLCRLQESRGHLRLARHGESVVINSSMYEPDTLELKPRDLARKKSQRDRDLTDDQDTHDQIDPIRRRDWDLEERAAARKERFREDKDVSGSNIDAPQRSRQTSPDHFEEGTTVTASRDCVSGKRNEHNISRGSRDDGSGTTTPNGVEAAETHAASRSIHCASPPPDSQIPAEKPFDTDSTMKAETSPHRSAARKSGSMPSTTEGDEKVTALS